MEFEPLVVLLCPPSTSLEVVNWLKDLITKKRTEHGAELLAHTLKRPNPPGPKDKHTILIGGETMRLIEGADIMGLQKEYSNGTMREFSADNIAGFVNSDDIEAFLTNSEKQKVIRHELLNLTADVDEINYPEPNIKFYDSELIISRLREEGVIESLFPLHDLGQLDNLKNHWCKSFFTFQPIHKIQQYFGEQVAMYFAFLGTYTTFLFPPAILGILTLFSSSPYLVPGICMVNVVWTTVFLEWWKRTGTELSYFWGTFRMEILEEPRPQFYGELTVNPFTGRSELQYSRKLHNIKIYCVSVPIIITCLFGTFLVFLGSGWLTAQISGMSKDLTSEWMKYPYMALEMSPMFLYAFVMNILNEAYSTLAVALNNFENHQFQSAYEKHLCAKLISFTFINSFQSLFYIAFYQQDMDLLRTQLAALLITKAVIGNIEETILPYVMLGFRKKRLFRDPSQYRTSSVASHIKEQVAIESSMEECTDIYADYLEVWIQFGYVYLFSAVFPLASFCAFFNNIYEIRTDAFKFCNVLRRPFPRSVSNIGVWQVAFELMSITSVLTNCALVALSRPVCELFPSSEVVACILMFVGIEHLIIIVKAGLAYLIPDMPYFVERAVAAAEFEYRQQLRKEGTGKKRASRMSTF